MYEYDAKVVSVHDGDTITVDVDLGLSIWSRQILRLYGINAPELSTAEGKASRDYLKSQLLEGMRVNLKTIKDHREKYGRYLATVTVPGSSDSINKQLVSKGFAFVKVY